jgi:hypothetical protein
MKLVGNFNSDNLYSRLEYQVMSDVFTISSYEPIIVEI